MKFFALCCLVLCASGFLHAQTCTLRGNAPEYANQSIVLYSYADYFTKLEDKLAAFTVDSQGNFSLSFPCAKIREVFMYLGVYKGFVYAVPGKTMEIALPPLTEKTLADELNPYFTHEDLTLGVLNNSDGGLNEVLLDFNSEYANYVEQNFTALYQLKEKRYVDDFAQYIDSVFAAHKNNEFFVNYKNYTLNNLRYVVYVRDALTVTRRHYLNKPILYNNAAYMDLFQQMWHDYLPRNHMKGMGKDMKIAIIYGKSPTMFKEVLEKQASLRNDTLKELLLLQCLDDCFKMPAVFPPAPVKQTLDSLMRITKIPEHKAIAQNIWRKRNVLTAGDAVSDFLLMQHDSTQCNLATFRGKYVYINYCRSENYACVQDYKVLQEMNKKTKRDLHIVTLSADKNFETFREFAHNNPQYNWTFLYVGDHPEVLQNYRLKAMPSYMLLDTEGALVLNSAPSPLDNFQQKFADIVIEKRKRDAEQKKQQQKYKLW
jgi:peroxiredoxin